MMDVIGLMGAHRTGKSTLHDVLTQDINNQYANKFTSIPVSISSWQREIAFNSSNQAYDWETRKNIQGYLLSRFEQTLAQGVTMIHPAMVNHQLVNNIQITERTPLDLIGYLLLNTPENPTQEDLEWIDSYKAECIGLTNAFYEKVFLLQPGILYVECDTSAKEDSIDKLNAFYLHTLLDPRLIIDRHIIDSNMTNLNDRVTEIITNL